VVFSMSLVLIWDAWNRHNGNPSMFGPPRWQTGRGPARLAPPVPARRRRWPAYLRRPRASAGSLGTAGSQARRGEHRPRQSHAGHSRRFPGAPGVAQAARPERPDPERGAVRPVCQAALCRADRLDLPDRWCRIAEPPHRDGTGAG
jgi:hypothetical protein